MTTDEMKGYVNDVIRLGNAVRQLNELDERAVAQPPPSGAALEHYARHVGDDVPPSFLQLLALHDGIACFDYVDVDLFPMTYLLEHQEELEEEWVDAGKFEADEIYVFGRSNNDALAVAFRRTRRASDGDMSVVMFDARGVLAEYTTFEVYLRSRVEWFQEQLDLEKADRAGLRDDE